MSRVVGQVEGVGLTHAQILSGDGGAKNVKKGCSKAEDDNMSV